MPRIDTWSSSNLSGTPTQLVISMYSILLLSRSVNSSNPRRSQFLKNEFLKLGLASATQKYSFISNQGVRFTEPLFSSLIINLNRTFMAQMLTLFSPPRGDHETKLWWSVLLGWVEQVKGMVLWIFVEYPRFWHWLDSCKVRSCTYVSHAFIESFSDYSLWAKDIIFVISDGYLDGMHAWLKVYHETQQSSRYTTIWEK